MTPGPMAPGGMNLYGEFAPNVALERQCPHCGGVSQVVPHSELQFVCSICGGPRIPFAEGVSPSVGTIAALKRAETARKSRGGTRALSILGALGGAFAGVVFLLTSFAAGFAWAAGLGAAVAIPAVIAYLVGSSRSKQHDREMKRLLDEAWANAAGDAYAAGKADTAAALSKAIGVTNARAEELQALRTIDASLETATGAPTSNLPHDPRFDALERKVRIASEPNTSTTAEAEAEAEAEAAAQGTPRLTTKS